MKPPPPEHENNPLTQESIMSTREELIHSHIQLMTAIQNESQKFQKFYLWLEKYMPPSFFKELSQDEVMLISHNLMGFHLQEFFSRIQLKNAAIVLTLDSPGADLTIMKNFAMFGIKNYRAFVSSEAFPTEGETKPLRVAVLHFTEAFETKDEGALPKERIEELRSLIKKRNNKVSDQDFDSLLAGMNTRFLHSLPVDRLILALDMFFRAQIRDHCQYEVRYNEDWKEKDIPSMQIVLAWRNVPKHNFLYRLARLVYRHGLVMQKANACYIDPYDVHNILVMSLGLHGKDGRAAWDGADIPDFLKELVTMKYFGSFDAIEEELVKPNLITGNLGNLLRTIINFIQQCLVQVDVNLYTPENIEEDLTRHPELTIKLCEAFELRHHPDRANDKKFKKARDEFYNLVDKLDTGREINDTRRKNVLRQGMNFVEHTLKTNFYRNNKTAFAFRLDPKYLDNIPFNRKEKFPELPYAIFFIKGMHFIGFHIRFKDLSRGGLRTIFMEEMEHMVVERTNVFTECYNLAYTQQKKNKDIPEGGAKAVIFLKPYSRLQSEADILTKELRRTSTCGEEKIQKTIENFKKDQKLEYLYQTQRAFVNGLLTIVNCNKDGKLNAKHIVDHWGKPEYIYLGPDENMHNTMIEWIANRSKKYEYKPGKAFITSKPGIGINHKKWGVTSLGINVYMHETLKYMGINPKKDPFTIKISGGPDGDVAGNQIKNLHHFYRNTAKLVAITDISGTIYDPEGLDLDVMVKLFNEEKPIKHYPHKMLHEGGFLLDRFTKKEMTALVQNTLCWRKKGGRIVKDWLSGSEMNKLFRTNIHQVKADIFIPAGGRPRTLNLNNYKEFLDKKGRPTSHAIIEGANLYLTPEARRKLEEHGVLNIKDSSANKGGVIASSFEVLLSLVLDDDEIIEQKDVLINEILDILKKCVLNEAQLLLHTHKMTNNYLTDISERISKKINDYSYKLLDYLETVPLSKDPKDPMIRSYLQYCPPTLREKYQDRLIERVPDLHKKAIIATRIGSQLVYKKGLSWSPTIIDILPVIWQDPTINNGY